MGLVEYETTGAVARITMNRPPVNALDSKLIADIDEALSAAEDPAIRAVVIAGGKHFAAGADITRFIDAFDTESSETQASGLGAVVRRLELLQKPTIAAITGYALGGGLELAMGADFRYMASDAKVGQPEILLGIIPGAGGTQRLARIVGFQAAKEMNMSGRHLTAAEAHALGLADEVIEPDELSDDVMAAAARWAEGPTRAYWAVKKSMGDGYGHSIDAALEIERDAFDEVFVTADAKTGILAFVNKQKPDFSGI